MGDLIHLFGQPEPAGHPFPPGFWEWAQDYIEDGVNNLDYIVAAIKNAETPREAFEALVELKDEVDKIPLEDRERSMT
jgi:hypothetical protein